MRSASPCSRMLLCDVLILCIVVANGHGLESPRDMIWNEVGDIDDSELMGVQFLQTELLTTRVLGHSASMPSGSDQQVKLVTKQTKTEAADLTQQLEDAKFGYNQAKIHLEEAIVKMKEVELVVAPAAARSNLGRNQQPETVGGEGVDARSSLAFFLPDVSLPAQAHSMAAGSSGTTLDSPGVAFDPDDVNADGIDDDFLLGSAVDADNNIYAFLCVLAASSAMCVLCVTIFSYARSSYPMIYSYNIVASTAPGPLERFWLSASWSTTYEESLNRVGLDNALVLKFCELCITILLIIGFPLLCVEGPMNYYFGGGAAGRDYLSYLSFNNVENGSWLHWVHAGFVWFVVLAIQKCIYNAQESFLKMRWEWLKGLPEYRANTILVEGIPEEFRSDARLKEYFDKMLTLEGEPGKGVVTSAHMVKDTSAVLSAMQHLNKANEAMKEVKAEGGNVKREVVQALKAELQPKRDAVEREKVKDMAGTYCGFVTFSSRKYAAQALSLVYRQDTSQMTVSCPPDPQDIIWSDLMMSPDGQALHAAIGYILVAVIYFFYTPVVVAVTNIARAIEVGPLQPLWQGIAPSLGLHLVVSCLPTMLLPLLRAFFILRADAWAQSKLQMWYFSFLMMFVVLITSLGDGVVEIATVVVTHPVAIIDVLGTTMPQATHFYMNFIVLQWAFLSFGLLRFRPWWNFTAAVKLGKEEEDKALRDAEPEQPGKEKDKAPGVGSRSAAKLGRKDDEDRQSAEQGARSSAISCEAGVTKLAKEAVRSSRPNPKLAKEALQKEEEARMEKEKRLQKEEEARRAAEPEDQAYEGVGSRSARLSMMMVLCIVFGTLSPGICLLTLVHFVLCRLVYGYLIPFAETRKADLGGVFWVAKLQHLFVGCVIYCVLMTVVLYGRAGEGDARNVGPAAIVAPSILYAWRAASTFESKFQWDRLPFKEVVEIKVSKNSKRQTLRQYVQPELFH